ncbi:MAG: nucleotidyltransferase domain-containing protein [Candidatus Latescibacterota bacterium]|jgi:hypothetical protein
MCIHKTRLSEALPGSSEDAVTTSGASTREQILETLRQQRQQRTELTQRCPIHRLALFGSWARGAAREDSDVDLLVEVDLSIGLRFVNLDDELEQALSHRIDLVSRRAVKPSFWTRIESELIDAWS